MLASTQLAADQHPLPGGDRLPRGARSPLALYLLAALRSIHPSATWIVRDTDKWNRVRVEFVDVHGEPGVGEVTIYVKAWGDASVVWSSITRAFPSNWHRINRLFVDGMSAVEERQTQFFARKHSSVTH